MPLCPGGSRAKETTPGIIILLGALAETLLARASPQLAAVTSLLAPLTVDSRILCNGDPPPLPDITAFDFIQLATGVTTQNVKDLILRAAWFQFCECVDAPTPPLTPAPPLEDAPVVVPGPTRPCSAFSLQYRPSGETAVNVPLYGSAAAPIGLVAGANSLTVSPKIVVRDPDPEACGTYNFTIVFLSATNTQIEQWSVGVGYDWNGPVETPQSHTIPSTATKYYIFGQGGLPDDLCTHASDVMVATYDFYCTTAPTRTQPDCCPPDPALAARLDFLAEQIQLILDGMQPTGPLVELASQSIAGEGTAALEAGARQINVQVETFGQGTSLVPYAHPDRLMRAGTVRFGNAFGWRRREHVDNTDCLFVVPADSTIVSWSLSPGTSGLLVQLGAAPETPPS